MCGRIINHVRSLVFSAISPSSFVFPVIFHDSLPYFYEREINPEVGYSGKVIEVTGKIRDYNGPEIIVGTPQEITIIQ